MLCYAHFGPYIDRLEDVCTVVCFVCIDESGGRRFPGNKSLVTNKSQRIVTCLMAMLQPSTYALIVKPPQNIKTSIQRLNLVLCSLILYVVQVSQIEVFQCWNFFEQTLTSIVNVLF